MPVDSTVLPVNPMVSDASSAGPIGRLYSEQGFGDRTAQSRFDINASVEAEIIRATNQLAEIDASKYPEAHGKLSSLIAKLAQMRGNPNVSAGEINALVAQLDATTHSSESEAAAADDGTSLDSYDDGYYNYASYNNDREAYWNEYINHDYSDNPYVQDGRISNLDGFLDHYNFSNQISPVMHNVDNALSQDAGVHRNPTLYGATASFAQIDPQIAQANGKAKDASDVASNHATAVARHLRYMSPDDRQKALSAIDEWSKSHTLTQAQKDTMRDFRHFVDRGWLDKEAIQSLQQGQTLNNFSALQAHVDRARERHRGMLTEAAGVASPEEINTLRTMAQQNSINTDRPAGEWLADLGRSQRENPAYRAASEPIRENMMRIRASHAYVDAVNVLDRAIPDAAERDRVFYNATPEARMALVRDAYNQSNGQPMTPEMERMVRFQAEHIRTPADVGAMVQARNEGKIDQFYQQRIVARLQENAGRGDQNAVKDLQNLTAMNEALGRISDPQVRQDIQQRMRSTAFDQLASGQIDYNRLAAIVSSSAAVPNNSQTSVTLTKAQMEQKIEDQASLARLGQAIADPRGVAVGLNASTSALPAPAATQAPPSNETPLEKAQREAKASGGLPTGVRSEEQSVTNPEVKKEQPPATVAQKAEEAAEAAKKAGTSAGQEAPTTQPQTVASAGSRATGVAAARA